MAKEKLAKVFQRLKETPTLIDGRPAIAVMFGGYDIILSDEDKWRGHLERLQKWREIDKENVNGALTEAEFWIAYAFNARGGQYSAQVPKLAFDLMHERFAKAEAVLETIRPAAADNPVWFSQMLTIAMMEGWNGERRLELFNDAVRADPYFFPVYSAMATSLTPRWGGNLRDYHRFVESSVARTRPREGDTYYARLYWVLASTEFDQDPFRDLGISWPKMNKGFEDLMERHPKSQWNLHHYAYFACRADDGKTFNRLRPKLDLTNAVVVQRAWRDAYSLEFCTEKFSQRT
jgi:hypothetical protein